MRAEVVFYASKDGGFSDNATDIPQRLMIRFKDKPEVSYGIFIRNATKMKRLEISIIDFEFLNYSDEIYKDISNPDFFIGDARDRGEGRILTNRFSGT